MYREFEDRVSGILTLVIAMALSIVNLFLGTYIEMVLFNWFLTPIFNYTIGYWQMMGVGLLIDIFLASLTLRPEPKDIHQQGISVNLAIPVAKLVLLLLSWGVGALCSLGI